MPARRLLTRSIQSPTASVPPHMTGRKAVLTRYPLAPPRPGQHPWPGTVAATPVMDGLDHGVDGSYAQRALPASAVSVRAKYRCGFAVC